MISGTPESGLMTDGAGALVPRPRHVRADGDHSVFHGIVTDAEPGCQSAESLVAASGAADAQIPGRARLSVQIGCSPDSPAWQAVRLHAPHAADKLAPEGYVLVVCEDGDAPRAAVAAADAAGAYYGVRTLLSLIEMGGDGGGRVPRLVIRDWPAVAWRGTIEGFYGPPWSHADRLAHLEFAGRHKLNTYVYAPKDDPFHRARWREPYPEDELAQLRELVAAAEAHHVRFVFTISPGLSMVYSDPAEMDRLVAKLDQVWQIGVRDIGLLFDDIEPELTHEPDLAAFGSEAGSSALAHASICRQVIDGFLTPRHADGHLLMVPTDYAGMAASPYRDGLARELPDDVLVWWTGRDIVVGDVAREHMDEAARSYGHRLLLWDNFPVNDFDFSRVFLGPLTGRTTDLDGAPLAGITANPMPQAAGSELALATVADWAWNPGAYDAQASHARVVAALGGDAALETLIESCSAWPPSAPQRPGLSRLLDDVLEAAGRGAAAVRGSAALQRARAEFAVMTRSAAPVTAAAARLEEELRPWLEAQVLMGRAGLAALDHLTSPSEGIRAAAEGALAEARACEQNVLASVVPPFVEAALGLGR